MIRSSFKRKKKMKFTINKKLQLLCNYSHFCSNIIEKKKINRTAYTVRNVDIFNQNYYSRRVCIKKS